MSESDYYREKSSSAAKSKKRTAAELLSDSEEDDVFSPPKKPAKQAAPLKNKKSKAGSSEDIREIDSEDEIKSRPKKAKTKGTKQTKGTNRKQESRDSVIGELFGKDEEELDPPPQQLWSSLSKYLPTGTLRTSQVLEGDFFIELRVFDAATIKHLSYLKRFDAVQAVLRLQLAASDPQWGLVKTLFKEGKKKFDKEAVFYSKVKK